MALKRRVVKNEYIQRALVAEKERLNILTKKDLELRKELICLGMVRRVLPL